MDKQKVNPEEYKKALDKAQQEALNEFKKKTLVNSEAPSGQYEPQVVQAVDCVDKTDLFRNVARNLKLIDKWIDGKYKAHMGECVVASAGPSLETHIKEIKKRQDNGAWVVAVKHSLPRLMKAGIVPDAVVVLDPRDIEGTSTHNIKRKDLFESADFNKTIFFVASMTNPSVTEYLQSQNAKIVGWHATIQEVHEQFKFHIQFSIAGGSCSAMRAITLMDVLGFKKITLAGMDSSVEGMPKDLGAVTGDGKPKYVDVEVGGKKYLTTGELIAQIQDLERWFINQFNWDVTLEVLPGGLCEDLYNKHTSQGKIRHFNDLVEETNNDRSEEDS